MLNNPYYYSQYPNSNGFTYTNPNGAMTSVYSTVASSADMGFYGSSPYGYGAPYSGYQNPGFGYSPYGISAFPQAGAMGGFGGIGGGWMNPKLMGGGFGNLGSMDGLNGFGVGGFDPFGGMNLSNFGFGGGLPGLDPFGGLGGGMLDEEDNVDLSTILPAKKSAPKSSGLSPQLLQMIIALLKSKNTAPTPPAAPAAPTPPAAPPPGPSGNKPYEDAVKELKDKLTAANNAASESEKRTKLEEVRRYADDLLSRFSNKSEPKVLKAGATAGIAMLSSTSASSKSNMLSEALRDVDAVINNANATADEKLAAKKLKADIKIKFGGAANVREGLDLAKALATERQGQTDEWEVRSLVVKGAASLLSDASIGIDEARRLYQELRDNGTVAIEKAPAGEKAKVENAVVEGHQKFAEKALKVAEGLPADQTAQKRVLYQEAKDAALRAKQMRPNDIGSTRVLARAESLLGNNTEAIRLMEAMKQANPNNADVLLDLAQFYNTASRFADGAREAEAASRIKPNEPGPLKVWGDALAGLGLTDQSKLKEAADKYWLAYQKAAPVDKDTLKTLYINTAGRSFAYLKTQNAQRALDYAIEVDNNTGRGEPKPALWVAEAYEALTNRTLAVENGIRAYNNAKAKGDNATKDAAAALIRRNGGTPPP